MTKPESYSQIKTDVLQFLRNQSIDARIRAMVLDLVNQALRAGPVVLGNREKEILTHDVIRDILLEMLKEYQNAPNQN